MLQLPAELLSLSGEPVLLIRGGKVLFANDAACGLLGRGCTEKSPRELFGGEIAGMQAPSFVGETEVGGVPDGVRQRRRSARQRLPLCAPERADEPQCQRRPAQKPPPCGG